MTDLVYNNARVNFATKQWDWRALTVSAALVSAAYNPQPTDVYLDQIPAPALLLSGVALTNLTLTPTGVTQGIIPLLQALEYLVPVAALVLYQDTGDPTTSQLIYYSSGGIGFPFLAQGENFSIGYDHFNGGFFQV